MVLYKNDVILLFRNFVFSKSVDKKETVLTCGGSRRMYCLNRLLFAYSPVGGLGILSETVNVCIFTCRGSGCIVCTGYCLYIHLQGVQVYCLNRLLFVYSPPPPPPAHTTVKQYCQGQNSPLDNFTNSCNLFSSEPTRGNLSICL